MSKIKVKCGAIVKEVSEGALKWFQAAGWKILPKKEEKKDDKTNSKEITTT